MQIKQITDNNFAKEWDEFVINNSSPTSSVDRPSSFLQSWNYGENKKSGDNLLRLAVFDNSDLTGIAQFYKIALPGGKFYLDCKRGPVVSKQLAVNNKQGILEMLSEKIHSMSKKENLVFFRVCFDDGILKQVQDDKDFIKPKILTNLIEPKKSLLVNLEKSEDEILAGMKQKTRYNIRLAEKKGIKVVKHEVGSVKQEIIDEFYKLMQETAKRDKINIFNKEYYKSLLLTHNSLLLTAEYEEQVLSAIILYTFGDTCTYFYGASSDEKRNLMPNYLIQWQAIKWAKEQGYKWYDFWGVSEKKDRWSGITKFKQGFVSEETGREIDYQVRDFILNKKWYNLYRVGKILNRLLPNI